MSDVGKHLGDVVAILRREVEQSRQTGSAINTRPFIQNLTVILDAVECWSIVEQLRADEADTVMLVCDNPDFIGPGAAVECNGRWTDWDDRRFDGDNILDALRAALAARKAAANG